MKIRIPDYVCFMHDSKDEFFNDELNATLKSENGEINFQLDGDYLKVLATTYQKGAK